MKSSEEMRRHLLNKLSEQRSRETASEVEVEVEKEPEPVTSEKLGCKLSYNDVFDVPCERVGLVNFSLDSYMDALPTWSPKQEKLIPKVNPLYKEQPEVLWMLTYCIVNDEIALLQGYQGTGKTSGIEYVCAKLKIPMMRINCSSTQDSSSIAGSVQVVREEGVPVTKYVANTDFINNMKDGVVCLLDEIFWAPDDLRGGTLMRYRDKPTTGTRVITAPEDTSGTEGIQVHEMSRLFYADNTLGLGDNADKFSARFVADTAFLDGINFVIKVGYLNEADEAALLESMVPRVPDSKKLVQLAGLVRKAFENGDLPITMSLRTLRPVAEQAVLLGNPVLALRYGFYNKLGEDSERDVFTSLVGTVGFSSRYGGMA